jgi:hypothetical protein
MSWPGEDRRRTPRVPVTAATASVELASSAAVRVLDISQSGMLIAAPRPAEIGRRGRLNVRLGAVAVSLDIEVKRVDAGGGAGATAPYTLGVEYVELTDAVRRRIAEFLRTD